MNNSEIDDYECAVRLYLEDSGISDESVIRRYTSEYRDVHSPTHLVNSREYISAINTIKDARNEDETSNINRQYDLSVRNIYQLTNHNSDFTSYFDPFYGFSSLNNNINSNLNINNNTSYFSN